MKVDVSRLNIPLTLPLTPPLLPLVLHLLLSPGVQAEAVWPGMSHIPAERSLWTAKLFLSFAREPEAPVSWFDLTWFQQLRGGIGGENDAEVRAAARRWAACPAFDPNPASEHEHECEGRERRHSLADLLGLGCARTLFCWRAFVRLRTRRGDFETEAPDDEAQENESLREPSVPALPSDPLPMDFAGPIPIPLTPTPPPVLGPTHPWHVERHRFVCCQHLEG